MSSEIKNWGVSPQERDLIERRHAMRMKLRKEYQKKLHNPYAHMAGEGGYVVSNLNTRFRLKRLIRGIL
jgi:hypothetical protein